MGIKYLANGQEVTVIQKLDDGYLVSCLYDYGVDDDFEDRDNPRIVAEVFDVAPTAKFDTRIADLQAKIASLEEEHDALTRQIRSINEQEKSRFAKLQKYEQLTQLEDFIEGRITHYAEIPSWGTPKILTLEETKDKDYPRSKFRLLTLYGDSNGNLSWNLNQYRDHSGMNTLVMPATSYEEAEGFIRNHILANAVIDKDRPYYREDWIKAAEIFGVEVDPAYIAGFKAKALEKARKNHTSKQEELWKIEAEILRLSAPPQQPQTTEGVKEQ